MEEPTKTLSVTPAEFTAWRTRLGLTQAEAGFVLGVARDSITRWERGDPPPPDGAVPIAMMAIEAGHFDQLLPRPRVPATSD